MNTRTKILMAASAVTVLLGTAGGAVAHRSDDSGSDRHARGEALFSKLDTDNDGKVTRAEAEAFRDRQIAEFDADNNGELNQSEYTAMVHAMMADHIQRRFARQDSDNSGALSKTELSYRIGRMIDHLDRNDDGVVERSEMRGSGHHAGDRGDHHDGGHRRGHKD